jgi:hypothetical protein
MGMAMASPLTWELVLDVVVGAAFIPALVIALRREHFSLRLYRVFILLSAYFWLRHYIWVMTTTTGFGNATFDPFVRLRVFAFLSPAVAVATLTAALVAAARYPLHAALTPALLFLLTWFGTLRVLLWRAPIEFCILETRPQSALLISSGIATLLLLVYALRSRQLPHSAVIEGESRI